MIICYYTEIKKLWSSDELEEKMTPLPEDIKQKLRRKRKMQDAQLSVCGNLMILALLKRFNLNMTLADLLYTEYLRPYFEGDFDFNVSHSGNLVICCATMNGKVGADIELTGKVNFDYDDYFTPAEQKNIRAAADPNAEFFRYWARKEALLKAVGTGLYTPLLDMDVSGDQFTYQDETYYLSPISINSAYQSCIAHTIKQEIIVEKVYV